jgi:hypothetical protein
MGFRTEMEDSFYKSIGGQGYYYLWFEIRSNEASIL